MKITKELKNNKNLAEPTEGVTAVAEPAYVDAMEHTEKVEENTEAIKAELDKKAEDVVVKAEEPKVKLKKNIYNNKPELDECLLEDAEPINEVTDTELDKMRKDLKNYETEPAKPGQSRKLSDEGKEKAKEIACISMINSILAYGERGISAEEVLKRQENGYYNYLDEYVKELGRDRVIELIQGQIDDIADIDKDVMTDSEGVSYNKIRWKREAKGVVEDQPDDLYTFVYDCLFPGNRFKRPTVAKDIKVNVGGKDLNAYPEDRFVTDAEAPDSDITVRVDDEAQALKAKTVGAFLELPFTYKEGRDGKFITIHLGDDWNKSAEEYLKSIGKDMKDVRGAASAKKKVSEADESVCEECGKNPCECDKTLTEDAKIYTDIYSFEPWSGAVETYEKIKDAGKLDQLDAELEMMYPEGLSDVELNDMLRFEADWVYDFLGMDVED